MASDQRYPQHPHGAQPGQPPGPQYPPPGQQQYPPQQGWPPAQQVAPRNGFGITALVLGIVGLVIGVIPLFGIGAIVCGLIGAIFGVLGIVRAAKRLATNKVMAIIGTVLSALAVIMGIVGTVIVSQAVDRLANFGEPVQVTEVAAGQMAVTSKDVAISASALTEVEAEYLGTFTCASVVYRNDGSETVSYAPFDWKLQNPAGQVVNTGYTGRDAELGSGELVPGGTVTGEVCFEGAAQPGRNLLIMEQAIAAEPDRVSWVNDL